MIIPSLLIPGIIVLAASSSIEPTYPPIKGEGCALPSHTLPKSWAKSLLIGTWQGTKVMDDGSLYRWETTFNKGGTFALNNYDSGYAEKGEWYVSGMIKSLVTKEHRMNSTDPFESLVVLENYIIQEISSDKITYCDPERGVTFEAIKINNKNN